MLHRRADAVEPGALVGGLRCRERRPRKLLGIEAIIDFLRRVAANRQRARERLGLKTVAEAGHVSGDDRALSRGARAIGKSRHCLHGHDGLSWRAARRPSLTGDARNYIGYCEPHQLSGKPSRRRCTENRSKPVPPDYGELRHRGHAGMNTVAATSSQSLSPTALSPLTSHLRPTAMPRLVMKFGGTSVADIP